MKLETVLITPEMARDMLTKNFGNRRVRQAWVNELARRISDDEWRLTHQGVAFDSDGNLLDGQHRLMAVVKSNKPVVMIVGKGFDADSPIDFPVDEVVRRSHADALKLSKATTETGAYIGRLMWNQSISANRVQLVLDVFQPVIEAMLAKCASARRGRSASSVRAAVCIRAMQQNQEKTLDSYRSFVLMEFDVLPPSLLALTRQVDDGLKGTDRHQLFARAYIAFDETRYQQSRLTIRDVSSIIEEARNDVKRLMAK